MGKENSRIAMGAVVSTIGHELGVRLGGGMVAMTKQEGVSALIEAAAEDEEVAALLAEGPTGVSPGPAYGPDYMAVGGGGTYLSDYATGLPPGPGQHPYPSLAEMAVGADGTIYQDDETGDMDPYSIPEEEYGGEGY